MKYTVEVVSDAVKYIPSIIKIDSAIQKLMEGSTKPEFTVLK
jgi:hypothetical protein